VGLGTSGGDLRQVEFVQWVESARAVLEQLGEEKNILVGKLCLTGLTVLFIFTVCTGMYYQAMLRIRDKLA
jgi:hypothetical protein